MDLKDVLDVAVGGGVVTSLVTLVYQTSRSQRHEDERRLAEARLLLIRLIDLHPDDPLTPIHTGHPHEAARASAEWSGNIADVRARIENIALEIRGRRHRQLAAQILDVAEAPLGAWNEGRAMSLVARIKTVLGPKVVAARKDPHAVKSDE